MNLLFPAGAGAGIAALAWQFAPGAPVPRYPVPVPVAEARLSAIALQGLLKRVPTRMTASEAEGARVLRWDFGKAGASASSCTVTLEPAAPGSSSARLDCAVHEGNEARRRTAAKLLRLVMSENVEAALEDRPFDHERMGAALLVFASRHRAALVRYPSAP